MVIASPGEDGGPPCHRSSRGSAEMHPLPLPAVGAFVPRPRSSANDPCCYRGSHTDVSITITGPDALLVTSFASTTLVPGAHPSVPLTPPDTPPPYADDLAADTRRSPVTFTSDRPMHQYGYPGPGPRSHQHIISPEWTHDVHKPFYDGLDTRPPDAASTPHRPRPGPWRTLSAR